MRPWIGTCLVKFYDMRGREEAKTRIFIKGNQEENLHESFVETLENDMNDGNKEIKDNDTDRESNNFMKPCSH